MPRLLELGRPTSTVTRKLNLHRKDLRRPWAEPKGPGDAACGV
jgi:hypothetical protein